MEPIVTLPYSEWLVAERLIEALPARQGYSVYVPLSRQEKGVDLLITRRANGISRSATLQVKYSRAYEPQRGRFNFAIWFRSFAVPDQADFIVLAALYPNITGRGTGPKSKWWLPLLLLFRRDEMAELLASLRTKSGLPDRMFYFGFDSPEQVVLTRGAAEERDFTDFTFSKRVVLLRDSLSAEQKAYEG
jgi:hypothetical protein